MKMAIFGASGGIGSQVIRQALEQGHEVRAFVRDPALRSRRCRRRPDRDELDRHDHNYN